MGEATSKRFELTEGEAPLRIEAVELHRVFETDRDGRNWVHVWVTAEVTPVDDAFQSITADVAFGLEGKDGEIGVCASHAVTFEKAGTTAVKADGGLRIDSQADVTGVKAKIDLVKVVHHTAELNFAAKT